MLRRTSSRRDARFRALLEAQGLRITEQRLSVLRALSWSRTPVSFPELAERLAGDLDRATVYRNLLALAEAGILVRSQLGDGVWRYELPETAQGSHGHHPHLVCVDCGGVSCLPVNAVSIRRATAAQVEVTEIQLRGLCAACHR